MPQERELPKFARLPGSADVTEAVRVTFRDRVFRSRTIVFEDGRTLAVENSTVVVSDEAQIAALGRHPEFERAADGS
ncbi:hypothetical protein R69658_05392 [Paraburkholderia aspalathi]|uniref:Uncharacterized protein n=1 Tax=Paraburkholderia aspalathi TaxID=1324617 RepID=A0ABN7MKS5_9BURK|nr:hypothetical protein [Paraburkholderia aspalathi]MBK3821769.1 hypothetical protein [Paraburkholderia aspalathi]MBK3833627.1 hypothetical protein [Paraburkholderia aspalathi]MBK3863350.1 hypothetical protein [Paraburkholderia aspalathi]CAE6810791.1 hypothetical protein R69658_05392 [Paraburkholderia aspalathi]